MSLYPNDSTLPSGEKEVGLDPATGKFTAGDPQTGLLPSRFPPETINLILDLLGEAIQGGLDGANNTDTSQLLSAINALALAQANSIQASQADWNASSASKWASPDLILANLASINAPAIGTFAQRFEDEGVLIREGWYPLEGQVLSTAVPNTPGARFLDFVQNRATDLVASGAVIIDSGAQTISLPNMVGTDANGNSIGRFLRHAPAGIAVGTGQDDAFQGHWHELRTAGVIRGTRRRSVKTNEDYPNLNDGDGSGTITSWWTAAAPQPDLVNNTGTPRIANETRPANMAINFCIYLGT